MEGLRMMSQILHSCATYCSYTYLHGPLRDAHTGGSWGSCSLCNLCALCTLCSNLYTFCTSSASLLHTLRSALGPRAAFFPD